MNIAALVSGGVDSSVTIPLLKEQGFEPVIFYIKIGMEDKAGFMDCPSEEDIEIVTWIAKKYGCRMEIVDLQNDYWESVVAYTIDSVKKGLTPNPDVMCNLLIKFGVFNERYGKRFRPHYHRTLCRQGGAQW
jgi:tRNA U34 2-thiouridine synthase MnmA/TrmU